MSGIETVTTLGLCALEGINELTVDEIQSFLRSMSLRYSCLPSSQSQQHETLLQTLWNE